jgi:hypothetical protein
MSKADRSGKKEFTCPMCGKSIDLGIDDTADEDGKVMHAECYFKRVGGDIRTVPVCPICGKSCTLGECVTNARGLTVHRECYRAALIEGRESL